MKKKDSRRKPKEPSEIVVSIAGDDYHLRVLSGTLVISTDNETRVVDTIIDLPPRRITVRCGQACAMLRWSLEINDVLWRLWCDKHGIEQPARSEVAAMWRKDPDAK